MSKSCKQCGEPTGVDAKLLAFLEKISPRVGDTTLLIPPPTNCPSCRLQRLMSHRSWWFVNSRKCSMTGETIFSNHLPDATYPVYKNEIWFSDAWDAMDYGAELRLDSPIFPQLFALSQRVPRPARTGTNFDNSDYSNNSIDVRDCYLTFGAVSTEGCFYLDGATFAKDSIDCSMLRFSELCYDCSNCDSCYNLHSSQQCSNCQDSSFLFNCKSCHHCFGCINLLHKQYCMFNEQLTQAEYEARLASYRLHDYSARMAAKAECERFFHQHPIPHAFLSNCEDTTGNYVFNSAGITNGFFISKCENLTNCYGSTERVRDSHDVCSGGLDVELCYQTVQCAMGIYNLALCRACMQGCRELLYCSWCVGCSNCFGCFGLKRKQYCILNQQYSKEEYEALVPKLIEHMRNTREWGEFFPMSHADFPYNHSVAQLFFPLTADDTDALGLQWREFDMLPASASATARPHSDLLPESDEPYVLMSERSGRPFRVTKEELKWYRKAGVPAPRTTFFERMEARMRGLGGIVLYPRHSAKSGVPVLTTVAPTTPWIVWHADEVEREIAG